LFPVSLMRWMGGIQEAGNLQPGQGESLQT
jgi:hypothetical protein